MRIASEPAAQLGRRAGNRRLGIGIGIAIGIGS